jgi:hypothetical protein
MESSGSHVSLIIAKVRTTRDEGGLSAYSGLGQLLDGIEDVRTTH